MSKNNKNKNKQQNNNSQKIVVQEFDYDKLADAIVKAQIRADEEKEKEIEEKPKKRKNLFKVVFDILFNRKKTNGKFLPEVMAELLWWIFIGIAIFLVGFAMSALAIGIYMIVRMSNDMPVNVVSIAIVVWCFLLMGVSLTLALLMRAIANDIEKERDKNYLISIVSSLIGFIAMIIALIALFKGVG